MDILKLENKWAEINQEKILDFKSIRISEDCISDLYLSYNNTGNRCLILSVGNSVSIDFDPEIREHISIQYFDKSNHIVIQLREKRFNEIFNTFIISIFYKIKSIQNIDEAAREVVKIYYEWSIFFSKLNSSPLSLIDVMGLIGELFVLNTLITESTAKEINDILLGWKGPFDKGHDFIFSSKDIEVKTKELSKIDVSISSEFQLELPYGKTLELIIVSIQFGNEKSETLNSLVLKIKDTIVSKLGDLSIFLRALARKGLNFSNLTEYDIYKVKVKSMISYNCSASGFPRLSVSNIPQEIKELRFKLVTSKLDDFIINKKEY